MRFTFALLVSVVALSSVPPPLQAQAIASERLVVRKDGEGQVLDPVQVQRLREAIGSHGQAQRLIVQMRSGPDYHPFAMGGDEALAARLAERHRQAFIELRARIEAQNLGDSLWVLDELDPLPLAVVEADVRGFDLLVGDGAVQVIYQEVVFRPFLHETLPLIDVGALHAVGGTGSGQAVAVLDTGVQLDYPMFSGKVVGEACFATSNPGHAGCPT